MYAPGKDFKPKFGSYHVQIPICRETKSRSNSITVNYDSCPHCTLFIILITFLGEEKGIFLSCYTLERAVCKPRPTHFGRQSFCYKRETDSRGCMLCQKSLSWKHSMFLRTRYIYKYALCSPELIIDKWDILGDKKPTNAIEWPSFGKLEKLGRTHDTLNLFVMIEPRKLPVKHFGF